MATLQRGAALERIRRLFGEGSVAGLADAQLLERFVARRDESAFAAVVDRHGPMVLGTCQAILKDPHDAEDAFQAVFLVLVRKAGSIRGCDALGGWLHQVASRIAVQANADAAHRRARERSAGEMTAMRLDQEGRRNDLGPMLHAELDRLPERYRLPVVLCDLEGLTREQAALQLRWTEGTLRGRLARARELLRSRLTRRGITLSGGLLVATLTREVAAAVPEAWADATVRAGMSLLADKVTVAGVLSPAQALVQGVLRAMFLAKLKTAATLALTIAAMFAIGVTAIRSEGGSADTPRPAESPRTPVAQAPAAPRPDPAGAIVFRGRVLGPEGRAHPGARLFVLDSGRDDPAAPSVRAISDAEGRFRFEIPQADFDRKGDSEPSRDAQVVALAEGLGFGLAQALGKEGEELTLRLVEDDVTIAGRVIDLQGQPVAGAVVRVLAVKAPSQGDLTSWLDALRTRKSAFDVEGEFLPRCWFLGDRAPIATRFVTDANGRFRIAGMGRERLVTLAIEGPTIETAQVNVMTRAGTTLRVPGYRHPGAEDDVTYVGAKFDHVAGPTRPIEGIVRNKSTGRPLAGVKIVSERMLGGNPVLFVQALTDAEGRYRLTGLPKGREGKILAQPKPDQLYLGLFRDLRGSAEAESLQADFAPEHGVRIEGRVTDKATGHPVKAGVEYFVFIDNPQLDESADLRVTHGQRTRTGVDGAYRLIVPAGPGVVVARAQGDRYLMGVGAEKIPDPDRNGLLETYPYYCAPTNYHVIAAIDPAAGAESVTCDLAVDPGRTLTGTVLGPDGRPLAGSRIFGLKDMSYWEHEPRESAEFTMNGLRPGKPRFLQFLHPGKKLAGRLKVRADETVPPVVKLEPWGTVTGRLVDAEGQPRTNVRLVFVGGLEAGHLPGNGSGMSGRIVLDAEGRFRIEGLAPGLPYSLEVEDKGAMRTGLAIRDLTLTPGEVKDLGDVRAKAKEPRTE